MNKNVWIGTTACLLLASCAQPVVIVGEGLETRGVALARRGEVVVTVLNSGGEPYIQINQDPVPANDDGPQKKKVKWDLVTQNYRFRDGGGIVICPTSPVHKRCDTAPVNLRCDNEARKVTCRWDKPQSGTRYNYTIRVDGVKDYDPSIMN
ncbi:MAG TPA: hypothetical protein VNE58_14585 [Casimicrobiaceae bacterium]|nr:hypothetical protein [Casimicrobiaceae bacterium]